MIRQQPTARNLGDVPIVDLMGTGNGPLFMVDFRSSKPHKDMSNFEPLATDLNPVPDQNGTISWDQGAVMVALSAVPESIVDYVKEYGHMIGERVDLGELNEWISQQTIEAIAELIFPTKIGMTK